MKNDELSNKTLSITTRSAKILLRFLAKSGIKGVKKIQASKNSGKQSYKRLYRSGQGLSAVDISGSKELKAFKSIAKEFKMDFAVKKDKGTGLYTLFFKAKDKEIYDRVFSKYKDFLMKDNKKSLVNEIHNKTAEAKQINAELAKSVNKTVDKDMAR